jgi:hypothetical protein
MRWWLRLEWLFRQPIRVDRKDFVLAQVTSQSDFVALERFLSNHRTEIIRVFPFRHVLCFFYLAGITFREVFDQHWNVFLTLAQRRHF